MGLHKKAASDVVTVRVQDGSLLTMTRAELEGNAFKPVRIRKRKIHDVEIEYARSGEPFGIGKNGQILRMTPEAIEGRRKAAEERELLNWWEEQV